ncbi:hypothetical protein CLAIMM_14862 [Cladophialophora immunda]|nr:hypothetical protein CLAIMM_14862 [Cladophialophora immunda]
MSKDNSPADKVDHGRCLCGAVTFTVVGEPVYNVVCHCENCRRQGGSTLHCASIFLKKQYTLHTGSESTTTYTDPATQSGQPLSRAFCKICGSKVWAQTPLNHDIISLPAGVLDSAATRWAPHKEQFCDVRCAWVPDLGGRVRERFGKGPTASAVDGVTSKL